MASSRSGGWPGFAWRFPLGSYTPRDDTTAIVHRGVMGGGYPMGGFARGVFELPSKQVAALCAGSVLPVSIHRLEEARARRKCRGPCISPHTHTRRVGHPDSFHFLPPRSSAPPATPLQIGFMRPQPAAHAPRPNQPDRFPSEASTRGPSSQS